VATFLRDVVLEVAAQQPGDRIIAKRPSRRERGLHQWHAGPDDAVHHDEELGIEDIEPGMVEQSSVGR